MDKIFEKIYFDPEHPAGFGGVEKLYRASKKIESKVKREDVTKWLSSVDSYTLNKVKRQKFPTSRVIVEGLHVQADVDLADMSNLADANDGINFLLIGIDTFSRKLHVQGLKSKRGAVVAAGFEKLWDNPPKLIRSDRGGEFLNSKVQAYFKKNGIRHFVTNSEKKANYAERVIRTLKARIYRYITHHQNERYIDHLQKFVNSYNNSIHSSIGIAPSNVTKDNERAIWWAVYWPKKPKKLRPFAFDIGDHVRISYLRHAFTRGYDLKFSGEVFKIVYRTRRDRLPIYKIKDLQDEKITGTFYEQELVKVTPGDIWKIEKVIRRRKRKGQPAESLVRWQYYPPKFDSWLPTSQIE